MMSKYFASCSFGKDSLATVLLALEHNEPLDGAVFSEVMFSHKEGISGEVPEHIEWIRNKAIPKLESMGVRTIVLRSIDDYWDMFNTVICRGGKKGQLRGFPLGMKCMINRTCKITPIRQFYNSIDDDITQYVGIAADEPKRLARLKGNQVSLLAKYGYTEAMAKELCRKYDLLSPIYEMDNRNGCWFCPNCTIGTFARFREKHPELWVRLEELSHTPNLCSYGFKYGKTFQEVDAELDKYDRKQEFEKLQLKLFDL